MAERAQNPNRVYPGRKPQALGRQGQGLNVTGHRLREARLAQSPPWSLEELSARLEQQGTLNLSAATLSKIERSLRSVYDYEVIGFCKVLNTDSSWLLGLSEQNHHGPTK